MLPVVIVAAILGIGLIALFWYGFRGEPNEGPALGNNRPWPDAAMPGDETAPYLPNPVVSEDEEFRRSADEKLQRLNHSRRD